MALVAEKIIAGTSVMQAMFRKIWQLCESTYLRRSRYEAEMAIITEKIREANLLNEYASSIDPESGDLLMRFPENGDPSILNIVDGNLILTDDGSALAADLAKVRYHINANGDLIVSQVIESEEESNDEESEEEPSGD